MSDLITRRLAILRLGTVALAAVAVPGLTAITSAFAKDSGSSHGESGGNSPDDSSRATKRRMPKSNS